jgi:hypothetical protein
MACRPADVLVRLTELGDRTLLTRGNADRELLLLRCQWWSVVPITRYSWPVLRRPPWW